MDILITVIVCLFAGLGAGVGTGFAGMSAAAIVGPMLMAFLGMPAYQAIGVGLLSDVLASAVSAFTYHKHGNLDIKNSLALIVSTLIMTLVGSFLAKFLPDNAMGASTQIALIILGLKFIIFPAKSTKESMKGQSAKGKLIKAIAGGSIVGLICGTIGAGGGMMLLFVLTSFLGYEMHMAVGTSVFIMAFIALTGGVSHIVIGGMPELLPLLLCVAFTFVFARLASLIANKVDAKVLNRIVGSVMILISAAILIVQYAL